MFQLKMNELKYIVHDHTLSEDGLSSKTLKAIGGVLNAVCVGTFNFRERNKLDRDVYSGYVFKSITPLNVPNELVNTPAAHDEALSDSFFWLCYDNASDILSNVFDDFGFLD